MSYCYYCEHDKSPRICLDDGRWYHHPYTKHGISFGYVPCGDPPPPDKGQDVYWTGNRDMSWLRWSGRRDERFTRTVWFLLGFCVGFFWQLWVLMS